MDITLILNIVFYAVIGLSVLGGIWGLITGFFSQSFSAIVKAILIIVFVFATPAIATSIGNIDISRFIQTINMNGQAIKVTSINETLVNVLASFNFIDPVNGASLYQTLLGLANQIISFATFFILMLLVFLLGEIIGGLFYAITLRFAVKSWYQNYESRNSVVFTKQEGESNRQFKKRVKEELQRTSEARKQLDYELKEDGYSKKERKELIEKEFESLSNSSQNQKKSAKPMSNTTRRLLGGTVGLVTSFITVSLVLAPLSSLVNTVNKEVVTKMSEDDKNKVRNTKFGKYFTMLENSNDTLLMKYLGLGNFDTNLMNQVTATILNGQKVSFIQTLTNFSEIIGPTLGIIDFNDQGKVVINTAVALGGEYVNTVLTVFAKDNLVLSLMPALLNLATKQIPSNIIDATQLDLSNIDYSSEITALNSVYQELYKTGLVDEAVDNIKDIDIDYSKKENYINALTNLASSRLITQNLPFILSSAGQLILNKTGYEIISTNPDSYKNLDWADTLSNLGRIFLDLTEGLGIKKLTSTAIKDVLNLNNILNDEVKLDYFEKALIGDSAYTGLLDLQLFKEAITPSSLIKTVFNSVSMIKDYVDVSVINEMGDYFDNNPDQLKAEFKMVLDALPKVKKTFIDNKFSIDDENQRNTLKEVLMMTESSVMFNNVLPNIVRYNLSKNNSALFGGFGVNNIQFESDSLIPDLINLIDIYPSIKSITDAFNQGATLGDKLDKFDPNALELVLNSIVNNEILNPSQGIFVTDVNGTINLVNYPDYNINILIKNMLGSDAMKDSGISVPSNILDIKWKNTDEVTKFVNSLRFLKENYSKIFVDNTLKLNNLNYDIVNAMFITLSQSKIIEPSLASLLNKSIAPALSNLGVAVNFNNFTPDMWVNLGHYFGKTVDILNIISPGSLANPSSLSKIDWMNADPDEVNILLTSLYKSNIMMEYANEAQMPIDPFGDLIYSIFDKAKLKDLIGENYNRFTFSRFYNPNLSWVNKTDTVTIKDPASPNYIYYNENGLEFERTVDGEIYEFCEILRSIQSTKATNPETNEELKGMAAVKSGFAESSYLTSIINQVNKSTLLNHSIMSVVESVTKNLSVNFNGNQLKFDYINFYIYYQYDSMPGYQKEELKKLMSIYDFVRTRALTEQEIKYYQDKGQEVPKKTSTINEIIKHITELDLIVDENGTQIRYQQLKEFLLSMTTANIFGFPKTGYMYSMSEQILSNLFAVTKLDQVITGESDANKAKESYMKQIKTVNSAYGYDEFYGWEDEVDNIITIIKSIQGVDINKLNDPQALLTKKNPDDNNEEYALIKLLKGINNSTLSHQAVPRLFDKIFNTQMKINDDINNFINEKYQSFTFRPSFDFLIHTGLLPQDLKYWEDEIQVLSDNLNCLIDDKKQFNPQYYIKTEKNIQPIVNIFKELQSFSLYKEYYVASVFHKIKIPVVNKSIYEVIAEGTIPNLEKTTYTESTYYIKEVKEFNSILYGDKASVNIENINNFLGTNSPTK